MSPFPDSACAGREGSSKHVFEWAEGSGEERTEDPMGRSSSRGALSLEGPMELGDISESLLLCDVPGDTLLISS